MCQCKLFYINWHFFPGVHIYIEGAHNTEFAYFSYYILEREEHSVQWFFQSLSVFFFPLEKSN